VCISKLQRERIAPRLEPERAPRAPITESGFSAVFFLDSNILVYATEMRPGSVVTSRDLGLDHFGRFSSSAVNVALTGNDFA
jgi:hypothetical protein